YLIMQDVLSADEVQETMEAAKRLHANSPKERLLQLGKGFETEPAIERLIDHPAVLPKVRALYGDRFVLQAAWCTVQPAGSQSVGWHQDGSSAYDFKLLGYPVPLLQLRASFNLTDQSEPFMGNMMMIPGSHRSPIGLPEELRREVFVSPIQHIVRCQPGAVRLCQNGVWHSPMPNDLAFARYNMNYIYRPPWPRRSDRFETAPAFLKRTRPLRRALRGDSERRDSQFAGGFPP